MANAMLAITINHRNTSADDEIVTNIFLDDKPLNSYATFVDVYDGFGSSIKNLLNGTGYIIPVGKEERFLIMFTEDAFVSGQILNLRFDTKSGMTYSTTCTVP